MVCHADLPGQYNEVSQPVPPYNNKEPMTTTCWERESEGVGDLRGGSSDAHLAAQDAAAAYRHIVPDLPSGKSEALGAMRQKAAAGVGTCAPEPGCRSSCHLRSACRASCRRQSGPIVSCHVTTRASGADVVDASDGWGKGLGADLPRSMQEFAPISTPLPMWTLRVWTGVSVPAGEGGGECMRT